MKADLLNPFQGLPVLRHLKRLTTQTGIIQHADHEVPDPAHGYSIDDNARALVVCLWHYRVLQDPSILQLANIYFSYIQKVEKDGGSFHNFLNFSEQILDSEGSEDSVGRAIWALGEVIASQADVDLVKRSEEIFNRASLEKHLNHPHVRTKAYILLGLLAADHLGEARKWATKLVELFNNTATNDWPWFEDGLYYANGILPYALALAAIKLDDPTSAEVAIRSFDWLDKVSRINGQPAPIGQDGWFVKGRTKAEFDQQPIEAADMVLAANQLFRLTKDEKYLIKATEWFDWYNGQNNQRVTLVNEATGGIYDAITPSGVNKNQGAESIVTYLLAYLSFAALYNDRTN